MLGIVVSAFCLNTVQPMYRTACEKALVAGTLQVGAQQDLDQYQQRAGDLLAKEVQKKTGQTLWKVAAFLYVTTVKKEILYSFRARPISDNLLINLGFGADNPRGSLSFTWRL